MNPFKTLLFKPVLKKLFFIKNNNGFTLLEIMVALSIIAIALTTVYKLHCQTLSMNYSTMFYSIAPLLAQKKLSELEVLPITSMSSDSGNFNNQFNGYTWSLDINDHSGTELFENVAKNLKEINLTVSSDNHQLTYHIQTYRLNWE